MNEIDSTLNLGYTDAQIVDRGQKYGAILKRSVQIIKLADPAALTITGGTSDYFPGESKPNETDLLPRTNLWIRAVASTGAYALVDGVSVHPYWALAFDGGNSMKQYLDNYTNLLLTATGRAIPLWITELGYISSALGLGCGPLCQTDFETESRVMIQNLTQVSASTKTTALYWFLSSTLTPQGTGWDPDSFALSRPCETTTEFVDSSRANAFYTFKRDVVDPGYAFVSFQTTGDVSYYTFSNGTNYLHILWSKSSKYLRFAGLDTNTFSHLRASDYRANTIDTGFAPASAYLTLTQEPVYLWSPAQIPLSALAFDAGPSLAQPSSGYVSANCDKITGWACNAGDFTRPLNIGVYDGDIADGKPVAFFYANQKTGDTAYDQSIANVCGGYANRTFTLPTPAWLKGTGQHTLNAYAINLDGSPAAHLAIGPIGTTFQCINAPPPARTGPPAASVTPPPNPTTRPGGPASTTAPLPIPPHR